MEKKPNAPWAPVDYDIADAAAIQAMITGEASPEQQKRAIKWIIEQASALYDQSFFPGGDDGRRNTDFAEGRRFVGNSIVKLSRVNVGTMRRVEE